MESREVTFRPKVGDGPTSCGALAIGHSHLKAVQQAYRLRKSAATGIPSMQMLFLQLLNEEFLPAFIANDAGIRINQILEAAILEGISNLPLEKATILLLSGNEYHFFGMLNQPRRFDFFLPERPDLPSLPGAEVIPTALIEEKVSRQVRRATQMAPLIKALVGSDVPVYAIESPPPIPDNDYILSGKSVFTDDMEKFGVSPPSLRYKLWVIQSRLFEQYLNDAGVIYLRRPAAAMDEAGFLLPQGWQPDGVHGSEWFGELILQQIDGLFMVSALGRDQP